MGSNPSPAGWNTVSKVYSEVERVTTPLTHTLLARTHSLLPLSNPTTYVFDNGCGTGVLTLALKEKFPKCSILAADASDDMVAILKTRLEHTDHAIEAKVMDGRNLEGLADETFTHVFSTFMVCLAPEPERIAREMYRVMRRGGVLGLAVWGDPYFGYFNTPWTRACREVMPDYKPVAIMEGSWTRSEEVRKGLEAAGFKDVDVWEERERWRWESVEALAGYFFEGGNPANERMREGFEMKGGDVREVRRQFERIVAEEYGVEGGGVESEVLACFAIATK